MGFYACVLVPVFFPFSFLGPHPSLMGFYACLLISLFFHIPILISRSSFQFDEMMIDGAVEVQIYQNRNFYSEAVQELSVPVASQLCCAVVSIEQIVA